MSEEIILSDRVEPCGSVGDLRNVYAIGSFDPSAKYFIEVETVEQEPASLEAEDVEKARTGKIKLPVKSVGFRDRQYFYAADMRFVNSVGMKCVFPVERKLTLDVETGAGRRIITLSLGDHPIFASRARTTLADALDEAAQWAVKQPDGAFEFPAEVLTAIESIGSDMKRPDDDFTSASDFGGPE